MQTKYNTLMKIGTGIIGGLGLYYLLKRYNLKKRQSTKSIDAIMEDKLDLLDIFGDVPYVPRGA